jgi:hypothetical protein
MAVVVLAALVMLVGTSPAVAVDQVTAEGGPATPTLFAPRCNDIGIFFDEQRSFVLRRTGPTEQPLTVAYTLSGTAQPGVHYQPLPGSVTFPAGATSVTVDVVPLPTPFGTLVDLTMAVAGDSATIRFVSPPSPEPIECGYFFASDPWNTSQSVRVGEALHPLTLVQLDPPFLVPATGRFRLVGGALPFGVRLNEDGTFAGAPLVPGTSVATIEACRPQPPGTCVTTDLTVTVQGSFLDSLGSIVATVTQQVGALVRQILAGFGLG